MAGGCTRRRAHPWISFPFSSTTIQTLIRLSNKCNGRPTSLAGKGKTAAGPEARICVLSFSSFFPQYNKKKLLTTEVFKLDITGLRTGMHLLDCCLHADISKSTSSGSVAIFTSDSPLAHAEEPTSHMNENTTVTMKSYRKQMKCCRLVFAVL